MKTVKKYVRKKHTLPLAFNYSVVLFITDLDITCHVFAGESFLLWSFTKVF